MNDPDVVSSRRGFRCEVMSTLISITYQDTAAAEGALKEIRTLQGEYVLQVKDAVVVERTADGKIKLHETFNPTAAGALRGAFWGCLIGWLFLNPLGEGRLAVPGLLDRMDGIAGE